MSSLRLLRYRHLVAKIRSHLDTYFAEENSLASLSGLMGYQKQAPWYTVNPYALATLGLVEDVENGRAPLTVLRRDGNQVTVELHRGIVGDRWLCINDEAANPLPLSLNVHDILWFERLPDTNLVYCQCNAIADPEPESFAVFFKHLSAYIEEHKIDYLAIDLRNNNGGDGGLNQALIHALIRCDRINRRGHLFVLIGRHTFSAAQKLTAVLERETAAVFVGEPSGSRPNFVGQDTGFKLPCSGLTGSCSSLYHQDGSISCDFRTWVEPDIVAEFSSEDAANNRDPAMKAILNEIALRQASASV